MYKCKVIVYSCCKINAYMQDNYAYMQDNYIYMQYNYVYM